VLVFFYNLLWFNRITLIKSYPAFQAHKSSGHYYRPECNFSSSNDRRVHRRGNVCLYCWPRGFQHFRWQNNIPYNAQLKQCESSDIPISQCPRIRPDHQNLRNTWPYLTRPRLTPHNSTRGCVSDRRPDSGSVVSWSTYVAVGSRWRTTMLGRHYDALTMIDRLGLGVF